jgi:biotin carboxyl carrier protein
MVTALHATTGAKVSKGEKLATLEAMKMQTTLYAAAGGVIDKVFVEVGDSVEAGELLVQLRS